MTLDHIYLVSHKRTQMSEAELANLERCQDYTFPDDLCEFLDWFSASGVFYQPSKVIWFCTFKDRCRLRLVKNEDIVHSEALSLVSKTWGVEQSDLSQNEDFSIFFGPKISGYVHVYSDSLDIRHDLDFDLEVCRNAEEKFYRLGFRSVEHYRP